MGSPSRTSQPNLQSARTGSGATSVNRCFTPPLLGLAPHRRRLRVLELSRATLFEPKRANVAAPGLGANHQTGWTGIVADIIMRRHGMVRPLGEVLLSVIERKP